MKDEVICPHCEKPQSDCNNGGDPDPWWNGEDDMFELECDGCGKPFILETCWSPTFETFEKDKDE